MDEKQFEQLKVRVLDLENQLSDLKNQRDPEGLDGRIRAAQSMVEGLQKSVSIMEAKLKEYDSRVEDFTAHELGHLFSESGLSMKDVSGFLDIDMAGASHIIRTGDANISVRSKLGKFLRSRATLRAVNA